MAKSIKYWLMAAGLIVKKAEQSPVKYDIKKGSFISKCGKLILENDKYIENKDTLWITIIISHQTIKMRPYGTCFLTVSAKKDLTGENLNL